MKFCQVIKTTGTVIKNIILGSNIISLFLLKQPRKMITYVSENLFLYKALNSQRGIPQKNVYEVLPVENVVTIKLGSLMTGGAWFGSSSSYTADLISLCLICRIIKPKVVFEIGTMKGYTAFHFALNTPDEAKIYTLDLPKEANTNVKLNTTVTDDIHIKKYTESEQYQFEKSEVASKIICLYGDSADFDFSSFYNIVDLFFIDGAHSYEYVRSDTMNALKCCRPGSVIAWHDFGRVGVNGVSKWLKEFSKKHEVFSILGGSLAFMIVKKR